MVDFWNDLRTCSPGTILGTPRRLRKHLRHSERDNRNFERKWSTMGLSRTDINPALRSAWSHYYQHPPSQRSIPILSSVMLHILLSTKLINAQSVNRSLFLSNHWIAVSWTVNLWKRRAVMWLVTAASIPRITHKPQAGANVKEEWWPRHPLLQFSHKIWSFELKLTNVNSLVRFLKQILEQIWTQTWWFPTISMTATQLWPLKWMMMIECLISLTTINQCANLEHHYHIKQITFVHWTSWRTMCQSSTITATNLCFLTNDSKVASSMEMPQPRRFLHI